MLLVAVIKLPESTHDAFMLANSEIADAFETSRYTDCRLLRLSVAMLIYSHEIPILKPNRYTAMRS